MGQGLGSVVTETEWGQINAAPIDRFTTLHAISGAALRAAGMPWWGALILSVAFEVAENIVQPSVPSMFPGTSPSDSLTNSVCDTAALMAGWGVAEEAMR